MQGNLPTKKKKKVHRCQSSKSISEKVLSELKKQQIHKTDDFSSTHFQPQNKQANKRAKARFSLEKF